jgi:hypothetical protein
MMFKRVWLFATLMLVAAACQSGSADDAGTAIESYWQARIAGDETRLAQLTCAERESQVAMEAQSFASVEAVLEGMDCTQRSVDGDTAVVECAGAIVATYNGENRDFPLGAVRAVREGGEWKYCGETE